ncbi:hypothetical protein KR084_009808 [Drosophila pseudotakahashii]|nr:hypothetical protein KR084_009808 [Drosophila pseudotakahashii]
MDVDPQSVSAPSTANTFNLSEQLMQREHNMMNRIGYRGNQTSSDSFGQGFFGSRLAVEKMCPIKLLFDHPEAYTCLSFDRSGDFICSAAHSKGNLVVWDWMRSRSLHRFASGHNCLVFQASFLNSSCAGAGGGLDIVSACVQGKVRRSIVPPSGGDAIESSTLYDHDETIFRMIVVPNSQTEVMSADVKSTVKHFDLRTPNGASNTMLQSVTNDAGKSILIFGLAHHPFAPQFCISGNDSRVMVYDKRYLNQTLTEFSAERIRNIPSIHIMNVEYNYNGSELLASYQGKGIALFDSHSGKDDDCKHWYEGHCNDDTKTDICFYGPQSEFIVASSDCGSIYFWDKGTQSVLKVLKGAKSAMVNILAKHPLMPLLASAGGEHFVRIWAPNGP